MTHFTVIVAVDGPGGVEQALAPFDENAGGDKWDWWQIGGRWTGFFRHKAGAPAAKLIYGEPGIMTEAAPAGRCDGGPKGLLDLDAMAEEAAREAGEQWDAYQAVVAGLPAVQPWKAYLDQVHDEDAYTIDQARADYHAQPALAAVRASKRFGGCWDLGSLAEDLDAVPRQEVVSRAGRGACLGYALLTREGEWIAPGEMWWWAISSDDADSRAGYTKRAADYIDTLEDSAFLVAVDCHI